MKSAKLTGASIRVGESGTSREAPSRGNGVGSSERNVKQFCEAVERVKYLNVMPCMNSGLMFRQFG